jgi:type I restriction enzyme S subunit
VKNQTALLSELCDVRIGRTPSRARPDFWRGPNAWVSIADVNERVVRRTKEGITDLAIRESGCQPVEPGTLLLSFKLSLGKVAFAGTRLFTNEAIAALPVRDPQQIDSHYLYYRLRSMDWISLGRRAVKGNCLNKEILEEAEIAFPSLSEQQRIAEQLDEADRLCRTRRYALELTDTLLRAAFIEMFGETDHGFPAPTVDELAANKPHAIRTGPFGSQLLHSEFTARGIAVLGIDNAVSNEFTWNERRFITAEKYQQLKRYTVFPGDVIVTIMGTCGRCSIVPKDIPTAINTKHLCCITLDTNRCLPIYLHGAFLHHPFVAHQQTVATKGAVMDGLNMEIIKGLHIPLPPLPLQKKFASVADRMNRLRAVQREALRQAEHLFVSLLHRVFRDATAHAVDDPLQRRPA